MRISGVLQRFQIRMGFWHPTPEPEHGIVALFDRSMVLLDTIVQVPALPTQDLPSEYPPDGLLLGGMLVSGEAQRLVHGDVDQAPQKQSGS